MPALADFVQFCFAVLTVLAVTAIGVLVERLAVTSILLKGPRRRC